MSKDLRGKLITYLLLLSLLLSFSLGIYLKRGSEDQVIEEEIIEEDVMPSTFLGTINYNGKDVDEDALKTVIAYMDAYFEGMYTLQEVDVSNLFNNDLQANYSTYANRLMLEARKLYDFDFTMKKAHYDLKITESYVSGQRAVISFLEDDYFNFSFLEGIESSAYGVENTFELEKVDDEYKIISLDKVQGYYIMFSNAELNSEEEVIKKYDYYLKEFKEELEYENVRKAEKDNYVVSKSADVKYDRSSAYDYLSKYYTNKNSEWYNFDSVGGNCQNYASQTMLAGGIPMDYYGSYQWKFYGDRTSLVSINEDDSPNGRSASWASVNHFYEYALNNEGSGLVAEVDGNIFTAEVGDIIQVGYSGQSFSHTTVVSKVVDDHILVNSNSIDLKDYPIEAYTYPYRRLIKIIGYNK